MEWYITTDSSETTEWKIIGEDKNMSAIKDWKKVQCVVSENPADFVDRVNELVEAGYMIEDINTKGNYHQALLVSPDAYITCLDAIKDHEERLARLEKMHFTQVGE